MIFSQTQAILLAGLFVSNSFFIASVLVMHRLVLGLRNTVSCCKHTHWICSFTFCFTRALAVLFTFSVLFHSYTCYLIHTLAVLFMYSVFHMHLLFTNILHSCASLFLSHCWLEYMWTNVYWYIISAHFTPVNLSTLHRLSILVLRDEAIAFLSAALYAMTPASIFMSALYALVTSSKLLKFLILCNQLQQHSTHLRAQVHRKHVCLLFPLWYAILGMEESAGNSVLSAPTIITRATVPWWSSCALFRISLLR